MSGNDSICAWFWGGQEDGRQRMIRTVFDGQRHLPPAALDGADLHEVDDSTDAEYFILITYADAALYRHKSIRADCIAVGSAAPKVLEDPSSGEQLVAAHAGLFPPLPDGWKWRIEDMHSPSQGNVTVIITPKRDEPDAH